MDDEIEVELTMEGTAAIAAFKSSSISDSDRIAMTSKHIKKFINENQPKRLIFDFERVKFFSSQVLGLLLDARAKLQEYNGEVVISAINPQLHRVFKITNLHNLFEFFADKDAAIYRGFSQE